MEQEVSEMLEKLGFMALKTDGAELFILETLYYFLVIEPVIESNQLTYDFVKYSFNKKKGETRIVKCYFEGFNQNAMLKRVGSYIAFMIEKGYLKTNKREILPFAREMSQRKIFI